MIFSERSRHYYTNNRKTILEKVKKYVANNHEKVKKAGREWAKRNQDVRNANHAKRRARKINACPQWLTKKELKEMKIIYQKAKDMTQEQNIEYHVDHIVPLQGKFVCGLHVPWNLQILTKNENLTKGSKM